MCVYAMPVCIHTNKHIHKYILCLYVYIVI